MLTLLHALRRLATLRWLGVFVCALATLLATTASSSALEPAQTKHASGGVTLRGVTPSDYFELQAANVPGESQRQRGSSAGLPPPGKVETWRPLDFVIVYWNCSLEKNLEGKTVALLADIVSLDARFNASVAEKKRTGEDLDYFELADMYETWLEACVDEVSRFEVSKDA